MKDLACQQFQDTVAEFLIRHQSILDILSKSQESNARVNRAVVKAVTNCGCVKIRAEKSSIPPEATLADLKNLLDSHLDGELCPNCREIIESEMGKSIFYLTALCHSLGLNLADVLQREHEKVSTLRIFNFT
ncbi:DUF1573 domain-containing protein [Heliobacterium gestii]|uniref:DUF1573 domain-containing protein n=1 Tax=Heliomicrobium gestii TaxID=2699 RepID=A0A845LBY6_HELGE|nr:DUF1573 domain-containing protein [Heliomicrobium gestii]MBM7865919.1 hypothetical protein [Heliomicrobium gestii]MZP42159.1 DUF1573 domain-containing protein [Heliomicrobium gestii]